MFDKAPAWKSLIVLALLIIAGFLGNYCTVPLFFGADFLLGSIAVLLILYCYGLGWGMFAAVVVHSYTFVLWGHPYGFINFASEALFVGIFLKRGHRNLLGLDWVFWLLVGMPLAWFYHGVVMQMDAVTATFIMFKQAINGIFNALAATLIISYVPLGRLSRRPQLSPKVPLQESLFNLLVSIVLIPTLLLTMFEAKREKEKLETGVIADLQSLSANVQFSLRSWYHIYLKPVQELAALAGQSSMTPSAQLQHETEILKRAFPDFATMHVENAEGRTIAFEPRVNEKGESTIGEDLSGRAWFRKVETEQRPVVSEVFVGQAVALYPIIVLSVPVMRENHWLGCAAAAVNLTRVQEILRPYLSDRATRLTVTDSQSRVVASTVPNRAPMQLLDLNKTGVANPIGDFVYFLQPDDRKLPALTRWKQSFYVQKTLMGPELSWELTAEAPVAPLQHVLYNSYIKNLAIMVCLTTLALLLSQIFSRRFARPLAKLAQVTANLPEKLSGAGSIDWPASSIREVDSLIGNFESTSKALAANFHEIRVQGDQLRLTNRELSQEIQERQHAEDALRESEQKYRALIETTGTGYVIIDPAGRVLDANLEYVRLTGHGKLEEILGRSVIEWTVPHDIARNVEEIEKCLHYGFVNNLEIEYINSEKGCTPIEINATVLRAFEGVRIITLCRDITERRRAEKEIRENEHKYRTLFETANDGIFLHGETGFVDCNQRGADMYGLVKENVIGRSAAELSPEVQPDGRSSSEMAAGKILAALEGVPQLFEWQSLRSDGTVFDVDITLNRVEVGGSVLLQAIVRDITERKRAEEEKEKLEAELYQARKMEAIGLLAGGIAHDFNNILAAIMGFTELSLLKIPKDNPVRRNLEQVLTAALRASEVVKQILAFTRQGMQERKPLRIAPIVHEALKLLRSSLPSTIEIRQEISVSPGEDVVLADSGQIHQVLMNLSTNAGHAMRSNGGTLTVKLSAVADASQLSLHPDLKAGPHVCITVSDTGDGMDSAVLERIFDPYFTTKGPGEGTGLGLSVVQGIVKSHGGAITVRSEPGQGTSFSLFLPGLEDVEAADAKALEALPTGSERILFVDDEEALVDLGKEMLEALGYHVTPRASSLDALETFRAQLYTFDLVITDMTMPSLTGRELAEKIIALRPDTPIILSTGFSDLVNEKQAKEAGIREFVMKPYEIRTLASAIRKALEQR